MEASCVRQIFLRTIRAHLHELRRVQLLFAIPAARGERRILCRAVIEDRHISDPAHPFFLIPIRRALRFCRRVSLPVRILFSFGMK